MACKNGLYRQSYSICPIKYQIQIFSFQKMFKQKLKYKNKTTSLLTMMSVRAPHAHLIDIHHTCTCIQLVINKLLCLKERHKFSLCRTESVSLSTMFVNTKSPKYTGNCYKLENLYNFLFLIINEDVHRTIFCMFCQKITCFENRSFNILFSLFFLGP
jgi:hypothetical protein